MSLSLHGVVGRGTFERHAELSIGRGEVLAITGANGSGKSTIVHTIAGLIPMMSGTLHVNETMWDHTAAKTFLVAEQRSCAVVFQDLRLFPHMNVLSNVAYGLRARGVNKDKAHEESALMLNNVGLARFEKRMPLDLSGGEQQRIALARALVIAPQVLLLDEPFASVDMASRADLRDLLGRLVSDFQGVTVLVSHDPADVRSLATDQLSL